MSRAHNGWRIRTNGQRELRDNLAQAIADDSRSRAAICREAGVSYGRISQALTGTQWIHASDVEALAPVLEMSVDELRGDSIFREDRHRWIEFDFDPHGKAPIEQDDEELAKQHRTRAICCDCGALRIAYAAWTGWRAIADPGQTRLLGDLHCKVCAKSTRHALLNMDANRNADEDQDRAPTREAIAIAERDTLTARVRGFGVQVTFGQCRRKRRSEGYLYSYDYDGTRWHIEVDPNAPARVQVQALTKAWHAISTDSHGEIDWDPRVTGTLGTVAGADWEAAADDLLIDVERFLNVERRRMVQHVQDAVSDQADTSRKEESR